MWLSGRGKEPLSRPSNGQCRAPHRWEDLGPEPGRRTDRPQTPTLHHLPHSSAITVTLDLQVP